MPALPRTGAVYPAVSIYLLRSSIAPTVAIGSLPSYRAVSCLHMYCLTIKSNVLVQLIPSRNRRLNTNIFSVAKKDKRVKVSKIDHFHYSNMT
jgi:hypothetical protein